MVLEPLVQTVSLLKEKHAPGLGRIWWDLFDNKCGPLVELSRRRGLRLPHAHVVTRREVKPDIWGVYILKRRRNKGIFGYTLFHLEKVKLRSKGS